MMADDCSGAVEPPAHAADSLSVAFGIFSDSHRPVAYVSAARVSLVDTAVPQASVDILSAFDVVIPPAVSPVGADSPGRPTFFSFPNSDLHPSSSSACEAGRKGSVHGPTGVRASRGLYSIFSTPVLRHNKSGEHWHNTPNPDHNNGSDTSDLPKGATTSHSRKKCPHRCWEQRTHRTPQASRSPPEVTKKRRVAAAEIQY